MHKNNAFTLVELLVVIAIISILAALLLPALQKAVTQARLVSCMSQQKQIVFAATMYADDFDGYTMRPLSLGYKHQLVNHWISPWRAMNLAVLVSNHYIATPGVLYCPGNPETAQRQATGLAPLNQLYTLGVFPSFTLTNTNSRCTYWMSEAGRYSGTMILEEDPRQPTFQYYWYWNNASGARLATKWQENFPGAHNEIKYGTPTNPDYYVDDGKTLRSPRTLLWCMRQAHDQDMFNIAFVDGVVGHLKPGGDYAMDYTTFLATDAMDTMRPLVKRHYPGYQAPE